MKRIRTIAVAVCLLSSAAAFPAPEGPRVDIDVAGAPSRDVFEILARALGVGLQLEMHVGDRLTMRLQNVSAKTALEAACESLGTSWRIEDGKLIVEHASPPPRPVGALLDETVGISLVEAEVSKVVAPMAHMAGIEVEIDGDLGSQRVSIEMEQGTFREALERLCEAASCTWSLEERSEATVLTLRPRE